MDLDDVYVQIGEFGLQQKIYFFSLCLFNLYAPFHLVQSVFTGMAEYNFENYDLEKLTKER